MSIRLPHYLMAGATAVFLVSTTGMAVGREALYRLVGAGAICGLFWELWNFWAKSKWVYDIMLLQCFGESTGSQC